MVKLVESAPLPSLIPIRPRNEVALFHACMPTLILALEVFIGLEKLEVGDLFGSFFWCRTLLTSAHNDIIIIAAEELQYSYTNDFILYSCFPSPAWDFGINIY